MTPFVSLDLAGGDTPPFCQEVVSSASILYTHNTRHNRGFSVRFFPLLTHHTVAPTVQVRKQQGLVSYEQQRRG